NRTTLLTNFSISDLLRPKLKGRLARTIRGIWPRGRSLRAALEFSRASWFAARESRRHRGGELVELGFEECVGDERDAERLHRVAAANFERFAHVVFQRIGGQRGGEGGL